MTGCTWERPPGLSRARWSERLETAHELAQAARPTALAVDESNACLTFARMVDDAARKVERRLAAGRGDLQDDVGSDGRLQRPQDKAAADADLAQLGINRLQTGGDPNFAWNSNWDPRVLAAARGRPLAAQRLDHEVAFGGLVSLEGDRRAGAHAHARQRGAPRGHDAPDQDLVRQAVARHLDDDRRPRRQLGRRRAEDAPGGDVGKVMLFELLEVPAANAKNVHGGSQPGE